MSLSADGNYSVQTMNRIMEVVRLMATMKNPKRGDATTHVKSLASKWGISETQTWQIWSTAKEQYADVNDSYKAELLQEVLVRSRKHWEMAIEDGNYEAADKITERLVKLLGLDAPEKLQISGDDKKPLNIQLDLH